MTTFYNVLYLHESPQADMFKGRTERFVSSHLDKSVAEQVADHHCGWVEEMHEECHPEFIASMQRLDQQFINKTC